MTVLSVDITTAQGSLALVRDGHLLEEFRLDAPTGYGEIVFAALDGLLKRHSLTLDDVDLFAAASGPGTFTGVRMGLTLVQGLAEALGKPVVGVSNLEALAYTGSGDVRRPVLDARRGEFYTAAYNAEGHLLEPERLQAIKPEHALEQRSPLAAAVAFLAEKHLPQDPALLDANYIRRSDAELNLIVRPPSPPRT